MFQSVEDMQKFSKDNLDLATKSLSVISGGLQNLVADSVDYTKKSFDASVAAAEKLVGVKSVEKAMEIQTAFAKSSYEGFVAQSTKFGEALTTLARESYKPFEGALAKASTK